MSTYTIANDNFNANDLRNDYESEKHCYSDFNWTDLDYILEIAIKNPDRFPVINLQENQTQRNYIRRWVLGYWEAMNNLPSNRIAIPKSSCNDPAIKVIVRETQDVSEEDVSIGEAYHNLFMSAENIQGNLLEEYIATKIKPYGFLWCAGNVLRAIDFCNTNGTMLLQVKNKSNTENSSSSNIRAGTTIEKWYRLGTVTRRGTKLPSYKWDILNGLINKYKTLGHNLPVCNMSEEDYQRFLITKASFNKELITDQ